MTPSWLTSSGLGIKSQVYCHISTFTFDFHIFLTGCLYVVLAHTKTFDAHNDVQTISSNIHCCYVILPKSRTHADKCRSNLQLDFSRIYVSLIEQFQI